MPTTHSNKRSAATQKQLKGLLDTVNAKEDSLEYAVAKDKLIDMHFLPDDPIVEPSDEYWNSFKSTN